MATVDVRLLEDDAIVDELVFADMDMGDGEDRLHKLSMNSGNDYIWLEARYSTIELRRSDLKNFSKAIEHALQLGWDKQ